MTLQPSLLVVDDEQIMRDVITKLFESEGYCVAAVKSGEDGLETIREKSFDVVLLDLMMPGIGGLATLEEMLGIDPELVVVMITAYASIENAVTATKLGAFDFVTKPFKNEEMLLVVKNGLEKRALELENKQLRQNFRQRFTFENIVGKG